MDPYWRRWWLRLVVSVGLLVVCLDDAVHAQIAQPQKVCLGTNNGMGLTGSAESRYNFYKQRYTNCTYVDGNLELTYLDGRDNYNLAFLKDIREVTGYVLIAVVYADVIPLTSLRLIRGLTLFHTAKEDKFYSLYVVTNYKKHNDTMRTPDVGIRELQMPALAEIIHGNVSFLDNYLLCFVDSINWTDIQMPSYTAEFIFSEQSMSPKNCGPCDSACTNREQIKKYCWGKGPTMCQKLTKIICSKQCNGRCFGAGANDCCNIECTAGCTGPGKSDCIACQSFQDGTQCVPNCPPLEVYSQKYFKLVPNALGKYTYGTLCVDKCPSYLVAEAGHCVQECLPNRHANQSDKVCVACIGPCPKQCEMPNTEHITSENVANFTGCTVVKGSIRILQTSFDGDGLIPGLTMEQLGALESIQEVTDYVLIEAHHVNFTDLLFLRNLRIIRGRNSHEGYVLCIHQTRLQTLDLESLTSIEHGSVLIYQNPELCYGNVNWTKLMVNPDMQRATFKLNRNSTTCLAENKTCSEECSEERCWSPKDDQCLSCAHMRLGKRCLRSCEQERAVYQFSSTECKECHPECRNRCQSMLADSCDSCVNVRDGPYCVPKCPESKYADENNTCQDCHPNCEGGCTGPFNKVGERACNSCAIAVFNEYKSNNIFQCLPRDSICDDGYYKKAMVKDDPIALEGKEGCKRCHKECATCEGDDGLFNCKSCMNYREEEACDNPPCTFHCVSECHIDRYEVTLNGTRVCLRCDSRCSDGCRGPSAADCVTCKQYTLYADYDNRDKDESFNCTEKCPETAEHITTEIRADGTTNTICSAIDPTLRNRIIVIVCSVIGGLVLIGIIIVIIICSMSKRAKSAEETTRIAALMHGVDEGFLLQPMKPTGANPDMASLRLIKESELRLGQVLGSGAFGIVYKGFWYPENDHVKIPIAIKVLSDTTCQANREELLEEARIMASVHHEYCLRILSFCMTKQMMLITQLLPHGSLLDYIRNPLNNNYIGSKTLLNWSVQIAEGMRYLEKMQIVHRDLAARNILVQRHDYVKITDFGLSKLLEFGESSVKVAAGKMPIKWLALESIQHRIFTHKSDVWSYGVTLWEMFTFGKRPHEGVEAFRIPELLEKGERLDQPSICTIDVYMLMIKCWLVDAESRPSFEHLALEFKKMATDPGRYLVIQGDDLMRMPSHRDDPHDLLRTLSIPVGDGDEPIVSADDYLQPQSYPSRSDEPPDSPWLRMSPSDVAGNRDTSAASDKSAQWDEADREHEAAAATTRAGRERMTSEVYRRDRLRRNQDSIDSGGSGSTAAARGDHRKNSRYTSDPCRAALSSVGSGHDSTGSQSGSGDPYPPSRGHPPPYSPPRGYPLPPYPSVEPSQAYPYSNTDDIAPQSRNVEGRRSRRQADNRGLVSSNTPKNPSSADAEYLEPKQSYSPERYLQVISDDDGRNNNDEEETNVDEYMPMSPGISNNGQSVSNPEYFDSPPNGWLSSTQPFNSNQGENRKYPAGAGRPINGGRIDSKTPLRSHARTGSTDSYQLYYNDVPGDDSLCQTALLTSEK